MKILICLLPLVVVALAAPSQPKAEVSKAVVKAAAKAVVKAVKAAVPKPKEDEWVKPEFCNSNDCPVYSIVSQTEDYELRSYTHARWVSTSVEGMDYEEAGGEGFRRCFEYIDGGNDQNMKIAMTSPVARKVVPGAGPNCESTFITSFFIPYNLQLKPPKPTNPNVYLETTPEAKIYVRSFPGYATIDDFLRNALELAEVIGDPALYYQDFYYTAGYDSPYNPFTRHNEVWFVAKP